MIEDRYSENISGQKIAGALYAPHLATHGPGQSTGESSFADTGYVFDKEMPPSEESNHRKLDCR